MISSHFWITPCQSLDFSPSKPSGLYPFFGCCYPKRHKKSGWTLSESIHKKSLKIQSRGGDSSKKTFFLCYFCQTTLERCSQFLIADLLLSTILAHLTHRSPAEHLQLAAMFLICLTEILIESLLQLRLHPAPFQEFDNQATIHLALQALCIHLVEQRNHTSHPQRLLMVVRPPSVRQACTDDSYRGRKPSPNGPALCASAICSQATASRPPANATSDSPLPSASHTCRCRYPSNGQHPVGSPALIQSSCDRALTCR